MKTLTTIFLILLLTTSLFTANFKSFGTVRVLYEKNGVMNKQDIIFAGLPNRKALNNHYVIQTFEKEQIILNHKNWIRLYEYAVTYFSYVYQNRKENINIGEIKARVNEKDIIITIKYLGNKTGLSFYKSLLLDIPGIGKFYVQYTHMELFSIIFNPMSLGEVNK